MDKWRAFGWAAREVDGHSLSEITAAIEGEFPDEGAPTAIIAHTVKGKGVSFMEDDNNWHYRIPTAAEVAAACGLADQSHLNRAFLRRYGTTPVRYQKQVQAGR